jgi:transposase
MQQKVEYLNRGRQNSGRSKKVSEAEMRTIVEKLYNTKGNLTTKEIALSKEEIEKIDRAKFGKNLS